MRSRALGPVDPVAPVSALVRLCQRSRFRSQDPFDFFPQPAICRIVLHALMPVQVGFEPRCLQGEGVHLIDQARVQQLRVALWQGQQHVGHTHHHDGRMIVLAAQKYLPAKPAAVEFDINQAGTIAPGRDQNMPLCQIGIQVEFVDDRRVSVPGNNREWFIEQPLMPDPIARCHGDIDGQIDRTTCQFGFQVPALDPQGCDRHPRGFVREPPHEGRKNQGLGVFPQRQMKVAARVFGNKIATLAEIHFQNLQRLPHLFDHVPREWRRHHVRPLPYEQRILQKFAQSFQRMADRRLRKVQLLAGASDIALAIDGFEHHEQVQVDLT